MIEYLNNDNQNMQLNLGKLQVKILTVLLHFLFFDAKLWFLQKSKQLLRIE